MRKILLIACLPVAFFAFGRNVGAETTTKDNITIEQKTVESTNLCVYPAVAVITNAMRYTYATSDKEFSLEITLDRPLCDPLEASAIIYSMPGNGVAWPQKLKQVEKFTLKDAGTTKIKFLKNCDPVQFDVVTGETPESITPLTAPMLLFPFDIKTAEQWWGCPAPTTTTTTTSVPKTTTTTVVTTTTKPKPNVLPATTVVATTQPPPQIGEAAVLARTGSRSGPVALFGAGLILVGFLLTVASRRL
jgi:hypothetical protein